MSLPWPKRAAQIARLAADAAERDRPVAGAEAAAVWEAIKDVPLGGGDDYYYIPGYGIVPAWAFESTGTYAGMDHSPVKPWSSR